MTGSLRQLWTARARAAGGRLACAPVDAASLAAFRILFGVMMAAGTARFVALGWVREFYVLPAFHFTWELFPWVQPLPGGLMYLLFAALFLCALRRRARFSLSCVHRVVFPRLHLHRADRQDDLSQSLLPGQSAGGTADCSSRESMLVDRCVAWPACEAPAIPAWTVNLLRFQLAVVFVFAGLAKINARLAARGATVANLACRAERFADRRPAVHAGVGAIRVQLVRRDLRSDDRLLSALEADPGRRVPHGHRLSCDDGTAVSDRDVSVDHDRGDADLLSSGLATYAARDRRIHRSRLSAPRISSCRAIAAALAVYAAIQIAVPLRSYWPGSDPDWTYRGFNFSWRVMLVEKTGYTELVAYDPATGTGSADSTARLHHGASGKDDGAGSVHGAFACAARCRGPAIPRPWPGWWAW